MNYYDHDMADERAVPAVAERADAVRRGSVPRRGHGAPTQRTPDRGALAVVAVAVATVAVAVLGVSIGPVGIAIAALVPIAAAAVIDVRTGRLPDALVAMAAVPIVWSIAIGWGLGAPVAIRDVVTGVVLCVTPALALHLAWPDALGFGDVKTTAVLGAVLGPLHPAVALAALAAATAGTAAVGIAAGRRQLPLGPGLAIAATAAVVVAVRLELTGSGS